MPQRFSPAVIAHHLDLYNGRSRGQLHFVTHFTRVRRHRETVELPGAASPVKSAP
jgi:hypothetical protein